MVPPGFIDFTEPPSSNTYVPASQITPRITLLTVTSPTRVPAPFIPLIHGPDPGNESIVGGDHPVASRTHIAGRVTAPLPLPFSPATPSTPPTINVPPVVRAAATAAPPPPPGLGSSSRVKAPDGCRAHACAS